MASLITSSLNYLKLLLENLPRSLPEPEKSSYGFIGFAPDLEMVEDIGDVGALNHAFEIAFGWATRSTGDSIIPINE
jgi:hypothetical protein